MSSGSCWSAALHSSSSRSSSSAVFFVAVFFVAVFFVAVFFVAVLLASVPLADVPAPFFAASSAAFFVPLSAVRACAPFARLARVLAFFVAMTGPLHCSGPQMRAGQVARE